MALQVLGGYARFNSINIIPINDDLTTII